MKFNYPTFCFYYLNAARVISIVSLLLVFASSIFVIVQDVRAVNAFLGGRGSENMADCDYIDGSDVPNQAAGVFWAVVNRLLIIFEVTILLLSEVGWPMKIFDRFFPILGSEFGLGALGVFQSLIGASILSHHCDDFTLVSGFFLFCIGCVNMLSGIIWREDAKYKRSFSYREDTPAGLPVHTTGSPSFRSSALFLGRRPTARIDDPLEKGYGFGRQGEKAAGLKGFILQPPAESLPRYSTRPVSEARNENVAEVPRPQSTGSLFSSASEPEVQKMPTFKSSTTAV